ncbi:MAG: HAD-IIA family hydrolase [Epsilonproteobacteria bacterium]|nr:HAD-IIA family hydrolase [Campylobacterota bacterium]
MRGFFLDIQGTLIDDKDFKPIEGAVEFTRYLSKRGVPFVLLTNNTKRDSKEFKEYLRDLGFEFKHYLDPLMVLDELIKEPVAAYGNEKFLDLTQKRYNIDYTNPKSVVLGLKLFSNDELSEIIEHLLKGVEFIGMHKTSLYQKGAKRYPGLGAVLEMLKYATSRDYLVAGKPSYEFFKRASDKIGLSFDKITLISDDLYGDLLPAKNLGIKTVLVLSGKIKNKNEIAQNPDLILQNIGECLKESECLMN